MSEINAGSVAVFVVPDMRKFKPEVEAKTKGMKATIGVDADTSQAGAQIDEVARDRRANVKVDVDKSGIDSATRGISGLTAALLALGPALVPITGAAVGGLGAFGASALAGGAGAGALGASLIGNIKNVLGAQKDMAKAKQDVATATTNQATANQAVTSAERTLVSAQASSKIATMGLTQARDAERQSLRALTDQIKGAALAEGDASIAVRQARKSLNDTLKNKKSTQLDRDAARQSYKDALFQLDQVKKRRKEISANAAKERAAGVEGSAAVISAKQNVASAEQGVASAQDSVTVARANAKKATDAYTVAQKGLADTQKILAGPAAARFVKSLGRAKDAWKDYLKVTAGPSFKVASKGLGLFSALLPKAGQISNIAGKAVSGLLGELKRFGKTDTAASFFDFFKSFTGPAIKQFGHIMGNLALGVGGLLKAFAPAGLSLGKSVEGLSAKFAKFGTSAGSNSGFQKFLAYVKDVGPKVAATVGHLVGAVVKLGIWLAPLGGFVLGLVDGLAKFIIKAKPGTLDAIAVSIGGIALAFGKGPLGLAFALGATLSHSDKFVSFLKKAGKLAGTMADAFNSLPDGVKAAAIAAVGVGVIGAKLKGIGGIRGAISGALTGGIQKVFVTNPGFGGGGVPGTAGKVGKVAKVAGVLGTATTAGLVLTGATITAGAITVGIMKLNKKLAPSAVKDGIAGSPVSSTGGGGGFTAPQGAFDFSDSKDKAGSAAAKRAAAANKPYLDAQARTADRIKFALRDGVTAVDKLDHGFERTKEKSTHLLDAVTGVETRVKRARKEAYNLGQELVNGAKHLRDIETLMNQGVSGARVGKVDRQLGGGQLLNGVLSIDKDGVAYISGVARNATEAGRVTAGRNHRKAATDGIRRR